MPQHLYPSQYKFHILTDKEKQSKRTSSSQIQMAKLRERRIQEKENNHVIAEQIMAELAMQRYVKYSKFSQLLLTNT